MVGINFTRDAAGDGAAPPRNVTADAFGVTQANWVNLPAKNGTSAISYGSVTTPIGNLTIDIANPRFFQRQTDSAPGSAGIAEVVWNYIDDRTDSANLQLTIGGFSSILGSGESYSVTVILSSNAVNAFSTPTVKDGATTLGMLTPGAMQAAPSPAPITGWYAVTSTLAGLDADAIDIYTSPRSGNFISGGYTGDGGNLRAGIAAVIIETTVPEPASLSLLTLGAMGLLSRHRRMI